MRPHAIFSFSSVVDLYIFAILDEKKTFFYKGGLLYFCDTMSHGFATHKMRTHDNCKVIVHILKTKDMGLWHINQRKTNKI